MARLSTSGRTNRAYAERVGKQLGMPPHDIDLIERQFAGPAHRLDGWMLPSMAEASATLDRFNRYWPEFGKSKDYKMERRAEAKRMAMGDEASIADTLARAEVMVDAALQHDPRLARRARWHRGEEGEIACPALVAAGDDAPFFFRRRGLLSEASGGEAVRLVISTDSNGITPGAAAAFIALVKILQQWRSVEVWWQGSWLTADREKGWVFLVPLVQGDMDFTRLDFCLSSPHRDTVSYALMVTRCSEFTRCDWNGCNYSANVSYLPGRSVLVPPRGISARPAVVALWAAHLLGFAAATPDQEAALLVEPALQSLPKEEEKKPETATEKTRREAEEKKAEKLRKETEEEESRRRARSVRS